MSENIDPNVSENKQIQLQNTFLKESNFSIHKVLQESSSNNLDESFETRNIFLKDANFPNNSNNKTNNSTEGNSELKTSENSNKNELLPSQENIQKIEFKDEKIDENSETSSDGEGYRKNHSKADITSRRWQKKKKHYFILSTAGKPIYSRYGDESKLSSFMGIIQAIVSTVSNLQDEIKSMKIGNRNFVFLLREPLYLVLSSTEKETEMQLVSELEYIYDQVLCILTYTQLSRIFEVHGNFDLRRLLGGTENIIDNLIDRMQYDPCFFLGSLESLPMSYLEREKIGNALIEKHPKSLLFGFITYKFEIVNLVRHHKINLHPSDLMILFNMAQSSTSMSANEVWTPFCFPRFNKNGFLFVYISSLAENINLFLVATERDKFYELFEHKNTIKTYMDKYGCFEKLSSCIKTDHIDNISKNIKLDNVKFISFKSKKYVQHINFIGKKMKGTKTNTIEGELLKITKMFRYCRKNFVSTENSLTEEPIKLNYMSTSFEHILAWNTVDFEMYAAFDLTKSIDNAIDTINLFVRHIKRNTEFYFVTNPPSLK
ncbi:hypothetical protein BB558_000467 [Smittium angustum]|uniref:Vacuolar fusion protein MON1 n=1 Tax=Smittium angustum TaxID=133377 RepID=A0A2U1JE23_SMIAN|nr:hypothetical protein BB558_000467 [Smittium angustum]